MSKRRKAKASVKARVPTVEVRMPENNEENFNVLFTLLLELHAIGGYAPLDPDDAARGTYDFLANGVALIAYVDGEPAGAICGVERPYWYSRAHTHLQSIPLYVRERFRKLGVGSKLLRAFRDEGERRGITTFASIDNPDRKPHASWRGVESLVAGYVPLGYTMKLR